MTDTNSLIKASTGPAAARLRKRRRAETRLRLYGLLAISLALLALLALLNSVVGKAAGALTESYVILPVSLQADEIDPDGARDPKTILRADFSGLTKDVLKARFPLVTERKAKRQLYDLVSNGAGFELAQRVSDDPSLVGSDITFRFLASDVTDLYLKGAYGRLLPQSVSGALEVSDDGDGGVRVNSSAPDFAAALAEVKAGLAVEAASLREQAARQEAGVVEFTRRAATAATEAERAENAAQAQARADERDRLLEQAQQLSDSVDTGTTGTPGRSDTSVLVQVAGGWIKLAELDAGQAKGVWLVPPGEPLRDATDWQLFFSELPEDSRKVSDNQIAWIESLSAAGQVDRVFNWRFFTASDSREPELAGIRGAAVGTFWTMLVTFALAFPIGVFSAIYLEEFAPRNKFTDFIEVNINNLAAVPSIIFGLLGLSVIIGFFGVPRSAPLAGGIVMALMTLPTIIIASRAAIAAVPPSIREAALGVGASRMQTAFHHVLPLSVPGMLTGSILGMARALGETAPLIMIGMVAFIVDVPKGVTDSATVLPVQVYRWSDFPERAFEARTAAAICVLLVFLVVMNALAIFLRRKFERRW